MVKREDYYLEIYSGPYKEVVEVLNSYIEKKMNVQYYWGSRRTNNAMLLIRRSLEEFVDKLVEIGEGYPLTKEEIEKAMEVYSNAGKE